MVKWKVFLACKAMPQHCPHTCDVHSLLIKPQTHTFWPRDVEENQEGKKGVSNKDLKTRETRKMLLVFQTSLDKRLEKKMVFTQLITLVG